MALYGAFSLKTKRRTGFNGTELLHIPARLPEIDIFILSTTEKRVPLCISNAREQFHDMRSIAWKS